MSIIEHIIALIAPHPCLQCGFEGACLCNTCCKLLPTAPSRCYRCNQATQRTNVCTQCARMVNISAIYVATTYNGMAQQLVTKLKFERTVAAAHVVAQSLHQRLPKLPTDMVVTYVPTAHARKRQRGYDQAALVARHFAKLRHMPFSATLIRQTDARQVGATRQERYKNMQGAFRIHHSMATPRQVLLIDDVITTGASVEAAAALLHSVGTHVTVAAFAHTELSDT